MTTYQRGPGQSLEDLPLFQPRPASIPNARNSDPDTSHAAGIEHEKIRGDLHRAMVAEILDRTPGKTAREYDADNPMGEAAGVFHRRLVELEREGLAIRGPKRLCRASGESRQAYTWYPARLRAALEAGLEEG